MNTNGFFIRGDFEGLDSRTEREKSLMVRFNEKIAPNYFEYNCREGDN